jgi:hypothetical protein
MFIHLRYTLFILFFIVLSFGCTPTYHDPIAYDQVFEIQAGDAKTRQLIASDADSDSLTYFMGDLPTKGEVTEFNSQTGEIIYQANSDAVGIDTFTFYANDGRTDSKQAQVSITIVLKPAVILTTRKGFLRVPSNQSVKGILTGYENADIDLDGLEFVIEDKPLKGTLILIEPATGLFEYTPNATATGEDKFSFYIRKDGKQSSTSTMLLALNNTISHTFDKTVWANDLQGDLAGQVAYTQAVTIFHKLRSEDSFQSKLVAKREALLLFKPASLYNVMEPLTVEAFLNDQRLGKIKLTPPNQLPFHDGDMTMQNIQYMNQTWSQVLPSEWVQPGLQLVFQQNGNEGSVSDLPISAATELMINTIDLGLLIEPRSNYKYAEDEKYQQAYFETLPVSKLITNRYLPMSLKKVVLPNGTTYINASTGQGAWHIGDMRERIAKMLISQGINMANYGIISSAPNEDSHQFISAQITANQSIGRYANGDQVHGGSGGKGKATIDDSVGNEWSHEIGHNYNLSHYSGGSRSLHTGPYQSHSAWGWISQQGRFKANFYWDRFGESSCGDFGDFCDNEIISGYLSDPVIPSATFKYNTQIQLNALALDEQGHSLGDKLTSYESVSLYFDNGQWVENVYLPNVTSVDEGKSIYINRLSNLPINVHVGGEVLEDIVKGETRKFEAKEGKWITNPKTPIVAPSDAYKVDSIIVNSLDDKGEQLRDLLLLNDTLHVYLRDGQWSKNIVMPLNKESLEGKKIYVSSHAGSSANIVLNDETIIVINQNQMSGVELKNGFWTNLDDMQTLEGYRFKLDAMAGGSPSMIGEDYYTMYSPYSIDLIQTFFEDKAIFNNDSITGFEKWNATSKKMEAFTPYTGATKYISSGEAVMTLVGFYDPLQALPSYIYPALWGSQGFVYSSNPTIEEPAVEQTILPMGNNIYKIETQEKLNELSISNHFQSLLKDHDEVLIHLSNGNWVSTINLPGITAELEGKRVWIQRVSQSNVEVNGEQIEKGLHLYKILDGVWINVDISPLYEVKTCQLNVISITGTTHSYDLHGLRFSDHEMNKFHVNVPVSNRPSSANIKCSGNTLSTQVISTPSILPTSIVIKH